MDKGDYLAACWRESQAMIAALRLGLKVQVPACPEWNTGQLAAHMVGVYAVWNYRVRMGAQLREFQSLDVLEAFDEYPELVDWARQDFKEVEVPREVVDWLVATRDRLLAALEASDSYARVTTWYPPDQTAGFVQRRMAQETVIHRWDAQSAHGLEQPIEGELARDGIDEFFDIRMPMVREWEEAPAGRGESFHFHRTDGPGEWLVAFPPEGAIRVTREHAKGDVAIRGPVSDLDLWLWRRLPDERLEVMGDPGMLPRWRDLVPAD